MKAIVAGTFDPFTSGHMDIVKRACAVFGEVTVAVAADTGKNALALEERVRIAKVATCDLSGVSVEPFFGLLSEYLTASGDCVLVRGVRNSIDMEYERDHARIYRSLCGKDAVCFITSAEYEHVSSTVVRELAALGSPLKGYAVPQTEQLIKQLYGKSHDGGRA